MKLKEPFLNTDNKVSEVQIDSFRRDLEEFNSKFDWGDRKRKYPAGGATQSSAAMLSKSESKLSSAFDLDCLRDLSKKLLDVKTEIFSRAEKEKERLKNDWSENPRLCNESLLNPLGLRSNGFPKEVPLTNALAWLITPQSNGAPMHADFLSALLKLLLPTEGEISSKDVSRWRVSAEQLVENDDGERGRIDIYAYGEIDSKKYKIAIEAKVGAVEGRNQLKNYEDMRTHLDKINENYGGGTKVVFLTPSGRMSKSSQAAILIDYADLLKIWLPVLKKYTNEPSAVFVRLLFADIARDLADMHIGDQLSGRYGGLPRYVSQESMKPLKEIGNE